MQPTDSLSPESAVEALWISAVILGLVEGLTEFLPVSSTGHMILVRDFFHLPTPPGNVFEIVIQLGAILAVVVAYWGRLWSRAIGIFSDAGARRFAISILLAFLPAVVLGLAFGDYVESHLFRADVVAGTLVAGGVVMILVERMSIVVKYTDSESISPLTALKIGIVQCLALVPGVSRSGATIVGARLMGVEKTAAAEFSFFVAIPIMVGATAYSLFKARDSLNADGLSTIAVGFVVAFISALLIIKAFIGFVSRRGLLPFAYYRIALGLIIFALLAMGLGRQA